MIPDNTSNLENETGIDNVEILGAREHNLKNIDVSFPRDKLVVITGISGSGKSSLAFDTVYAEGQRRYMECFMAYARSFIGGMKRPDVDKIEGLGPVISIEQKTVIRNPRSTIGTTTDIYDFMRLLFAKVSDAYSYLSGNKMIIQTQYEILNHILTNFLNQTVVILAPIIKARKGHYKELFIKIRKLGFTKVRVDGSIKTITAGMMLDRYKVHDIEIVVDRVSVNKIDKKRIEDSLICGLKHGDGMFILLDNTHNAHYFSQSLMDPSTGLSYEQPSPNTFSFNSPYGACPLCKGLGHIVQLDIENILKENVVSLNFEDFFISEKQYKASLVNKFDEFVNSNEYGSPKEIRDFFEPTFNNMLNILNGKINNRSEKNNSLNNNIEQDDSAENINSDNDSNFQCIACKGDKLKKEALYFKIDGKNISQLANMNIYELYTWFDGLELKLDNKKQIIATEILREIRKRIKFMLDVGLDYLHLNRSLQTLSGGESQRVRLATQIGTQLVGVMYILDEPSIGLHQRDNIRLIETLKNLRDLGNSVIVVEHDKDMMLQCDYLLDIGPGAGKYGGRVMAAGTPDEFLKNKSATADFLNGERCISVPKIRRKGNEKFFVIDGCSGNNLKDVTLKIPLGKMVCVTGISGSGKSSLIHSTLVPILKKHLYKSHCSILPYKKVTGLDFIDKVIEVDQSPIGRTPRSNPATYTEVFTDIRNFFAQLSESKVRGYKPGRFSFNVRGGRCEVCQGAGIQLISMNFLPDVHVTCDNCRGKRYNRETLEIKYHGNSISDILDMSVSQAVDFFEKHASILKKINTLKEVGLGYITLGQHATTLSGGEAQRVKLATELSKRNTGKTFYVLDEPTTGLHFSDIENLLSVLNKLVDNGNTVLIIEHNLDIIKVADYVIDIGPDGGGRGGFIVAEGTPEEVAQHPTSYTAHFLKLELGK